MVKSQTQTHRLILIISLSLNASCEALNCKEAIKLFESYSCIPGSNPMYYSYKDSVYTYYTVQKRGSSALNMLRIRRLDPLKNTIEEAYIKNIVGESKFGVPVVEESVDDMFEYTITENMRLIALEDYPKKTAFTMTYNDKLKFFSRLIEAVQYFRSHDISITDLNTLNIMVNSLNSPVFQNLSDFKIDEYRNHHSTIPKNFRKDQTEVASRKIRLEALKKNIIWQLGEVFYFITMGSKPFFEALEQHEHSKQISYNVSIKQYLPVEFVHLLDMCFKYHEDPDNALDALEARVYKYLRQIRFHYQLINVELETDRYLSTSLENSYRDSIQEMSLVVLLGFVLLPTIMYLMVRVYKRKETRSESMDEEANS